MTADIIASAENAKREETLRNSTSCNRNNVPVLKSELQYLAIEPFMVQGFPGDIASDDLGDAENVVTFQTSDYTLKSIIL